MKAVVMAGGHGTRLRPALASSINKHLYPVGGKPLIHWPLETVASMGISDTLVILNGSHPELLMETIGNGESFGLEIWYRYNVETEGASVGRHLLQAKSFVKDEPFILILGDSVYLTPPFIHTTHTTHAWVMESDESWDDMSKYSTLPGHKNLIQTGMWMFTENVFSAINVLNDQDVVRIRDIVSYLHRTEGDIEYTVLPPQSFIDCGTPEAIQTIHNICCPQRPSE